MAAEKKEKTVTADKRDQLLADALKAIEKGIRKRQYYAPWRPC